MKAHRTPPLPDRRWALFLDLDGTLLDIAPHPDLVKVPDGLVEMLQQIETALNGAVAVITGRSIERVDELLSPWKAVVAGEHGAYLRLRSGRMISPPIPSHMPEALLHGLRALAVEHTGLMVEEKRTSVTVHYRLAPGAAEDVRAKVAALVAENGEGFAMMQARQAVEVRPHGADKGWAVERLLREEPFKGRVPVFIGDDVTDEDGIRAAEAAGGHGLHVDRHFTDGAETVRRYLSDMLRQLSA